MTMNLISWNAWLIWLVFTLAIAGYFGYRLLGDDKEIYLIGETTSGHYQIESECRVCHKKSFGGTDSLQEACMDCHGQELKASDDSHPKSKFTDPRNADRVKKLDARLCITCHREHNREITRTMAVTLPTDFCFKCHEDIAEDRPTHKNIGFDSCASAGCHNFHDNRGLYEDFLVEHGKEPALLEKREVLPRNFKQWQIKVTGEPFVPLTAGKHDAPDANAVNPLLLDDWAGSAHALSGVNCTQCHARDITGKNTEWKNKPGFDVCTSCHKHENKGFGGGKHGMRTALGLSVMTPEIARLPMRPDAKDRQLNCGSCHKLHETDTQYASAAACMSCHDDDHTNAYKKSSHFRLWQEVIQGSRPEEQGVSCATCHMPRTPIKEQDVERTLVQHNQNDNLRPNEKMIRSVCMSCHGLKFSIDALADTRLLKNNFSGKPAIHIKSVDWALNRIQQKQVTNSQINQP